MNEQDVVEQCKQKFDLLVTDFIGLQEAMAANIMALKKTLDELLLHTSITNGVTIKPDTLLHQQQVDMLKEKWFTS